MNVLDEIVQDQLRTDLPELATGDTVKVSAKVVEGNRERIQVFEGTVMRLRGGGITRSITVRRIASRRRRRADVQGQQPAHREDRGRPPRRRPPRAAVLPARPRRQGRDPARAPHERLTAGATAPADLRRPDPADPAGSFDSGRLRVDGSDRPDPPPRAPPLERGPRPGRRRRRGRGRADLRRGRRGRGDHAARLPPDPGRPRLQDAVGGPARAARADRSGRARWRSASAPRRSARSTSSTSTTPRTWRCAARSPGSAATTTSSSTATGSPGSRRTSGRTPNIVDGDAQGLLDRLRVGRGQGRPRPDDGAAGRALSRATAGSATRATRRCEHREAIRRARADAVPPPVVPGAPADARRRPARLRPARPTRPRPPRRTSCWRASSSRSWPTTRCSTRSTSRRWS